MKNKKGFTLIELLVVIAIVGVLAVITIPSIIISNEAAKTKASALLNKNLGDAGETFVKEYPDIIYWEELGDGTGDGNDGGNGNEEIEYTCISVKVLISIGYLENNLKDPATGEAYDVNKLISVKRNKTTKTIIARNPADDELCEGFIYDNNNGGGDDDGDDGENHKNTPPTINYELKTSDGNIYTEGTWTNKNIIQYINAESKNSVVVLEISYNNKESWTSLSQNPIEVIRSEDINGIVYVMAMDQYGNETEVSYKLMLDKILPTCAVNASGTLGSNSWYTSNVTIGLTYGDDGSGVAGYGLSENSTVVYNSTTTLTLATNTTGKVYYGFVSDNAGNAVTCNRTVKRADDSPSISLACIPSSFSKGSYYSVPCSYSYGTSGAGSYSCSPSSTSGLAVGSRTITCTITSGNGKTSSASKTVTVTNPCECSSSYQCGTNYSCNGCSCYYDPPVTPPGGGGGTDYCLLYGWCDDGGGSSGGGDGEATCGNLCSSCRPGEGWVSCCDTGC